MRPWTVHRPQPLTRRSDSLWTVDDEVPGLPGAGRRMSVVKRSDGTLLFYNAIPVPDATLAELQALGRPAQLVLPNQFHALDAAAFAQKLGVTVFAPAVGVAPLAERVACRPIEELPLEAGLQRFSVEGFRTHEVVLFSSGSLIVGDLVTNVGHGPGFTGLMMRIVGFTGPKPKLPFPVRRRVGRDLAAVRALLERLAALDGLERIVPSHGAVIESGAAEALRAIAKSF